MTLCPVAIMAGCKSCPMYKICPAKGIIGDDKKSNKEDKTGKSTEK